MRKFSSYGPPNTKLHYYAPREGLCANVLSQLKGDDPDDGEHYGMGTPSNRQNIDHAKRFLNT